MVYGYSTQGFGKKLQMKFVVICLYKGENSRYIYVFWRKIHVLTQSIFMNKHDVAMAMVEGGMYIC